MDTDTGTLQIWVAVDDDGEGYVVHHSGDRTSGADDHLPEHYALAEEISQSGRFCYDLCLNPPNDVPGLWKFLGRMGYKTISDDEVEPVFTGVWYPITLIEG